MRLKYYYIIYFIGIFCFVLFSGCQVHPHRTYCFLDMEALRGVKSVAVLPFHNLSNKVNAGLIMTNMVMAEVVQNKEIRVVKYGDLKKFFMNKQMISVQTIDYETLQTIRQDFKVDTVIIGTVLRYEDGIEVGERERNKGPHIPSISISSTILDTRTGRTLGKGEFTEKGSATGYLLSSKKRQVAFALAKDLAKRLISTLGNDGV